jgi:hypothetical protein
MNVYFVSKSIVVCISIANSFFTFYMNSTILLEQKLFFSIFAKKIPPLTHPPPPLLV